MSKFKKQLDNFKAQAKETGKFLKNVGVFAAIGGVLGEVAADYVPDQAAIVGLEKEGVAGGFIVTLSTQEKLVKDAPTRAMLGGAGGVLLGKAIRKTFLKGE